jgi:hypothetical protein
MRTKDLVAVFGTLEAVGKQFGISRSAVSQWNGTVPERRQNELRGIHPNIDQRIAEARKPRRVVPA